MADEKQEAGEKEAFEETVKPRPEEDIETKLIFTCKRCGCMLFTEDELEQHAKSNRTFDTRSRRRVKKNIIKLKFEK